MYIINKQIYIIAHLRVYFTDGLRCPEDEKMRPNELEKCIESNSEMVCNKYYFTKFSIQSYFVCWRF